MKRIGFLMILASASTAGADPPVATSTQPQRHVPPEPLPVPQPPEHTAADVAGAPTPGHTSGRIDDGDGEDSTGRVIGRGALYVPKLVFEIGMLPLRGAFYAYDRYELDRRYYETFYNYDRTIALIPTGTYETGYGVTAGARFFDTDLLGEDEKLVLQGTVGTVYRVGVLASIDTGHRLGSVRLELGGNFSRLPREPFYGIGNGDLVDNPGPMPDIDALTNDTAVHTYTRYQEWRGYVLADWTAMSDLHVGALGSATQIRYSPSSTSPSVNTVYEPASLVGFDQGVEHLYGELDVSWDSRHRRSVWEPLTVHGTGSLALGFVGRVHRLDEGGSDFWRYGVELQHYVHLGYGPRVLIARFHGEAVSGPLDAVPFTELPMLGGDAFLRGYAYARFRDRLAAVASLQYMWNLTLYTEAFVFVDAGRVYGGYGDLTFDDLRVGSGIGLEFHSASDFLFDATIGVPWSGNGGVTFTLAFSPVLDARQRWR